MTTASIPSAAPLAAQAHGLLSALATHAVTALHLQGPGRWALALAVVAVTLVFGRVGTQVLAATLRWGLILAAVVFAYQVLRV